MIRSLWTVPAALALGLILVMIDATNEGGGIWSLLP